MPSVSQKVPIQVFVIIHLKYFFTHFLSENCIDISTRNNSLQWTNQTNSSSAATEFWE